MLGNGPLPALGEEPMVKLADILRKFPNEIAAASQRIDKWVDNPAVLTTVNDFQTAGGDLGIMEQIYYRRGEAPPMVPQARTRWLNRGLETFEQHFVLAVEQRVEDWESINPHCTENDFQTRLVSPPQLLMQYNTIHTYLMYYYLGESFGEMYTKVHALFQRLATATKGTKWENMWEARLQGLRDDLMSGRMHTNNLH